MAEENTAAEGEAEAIDSSALEAAVSNANDIGFGGGGKPQGDQCPECKAGAPGWMATFADMATLLMAFFVLILSFSDTELPRFEYINGSIQYAFGVKRVVPRIEIPAARSILMEDFTPNEAAPTVITDANQKELDPTAENLIRRTETEPERFLEDLENTKIALTELIGAGLVSVTTDGQQIIVKVDGDAASGADFGSGPDAKGVASDVLIRAASIVAEVQSTTVQEISLFLSEVDSANDPQANSQQAYSGANTDARYSDRYENIRADLDREISQGLLEVERDGDEVVIRIASQGSFNSGSAALAQSFTTTLDQVGEAISAEPGEVRIEGHTDNIPIAFSETFNSNWDLSAARASSVANYLTTVSALGEERVEVLGYADTLPLADNDTADGRSRNRRIEIRLGD